MVDMTKDPSKVNSVSLLADLHLMGHKVGWLLTVGLLVSSAWYICSYY